MEKSPARRAREYRQLGRFELRTVLLGFVVVATLCDVFLRPKPRQSKLGGTLIIESFHVLPSSDSSESGQNEIEQEPIEHGPWRLRAENGRVLAVGAHRSGVAQGKWVYYGPKGTRLAQGRCEDGRLQGRWQTWTVGGRRLCEANFAKAEPLPSSMPVSALVADRSVPSVRDPRRQGLVTWWDSIDQDEPHVESHERRIEYRDDRRLSTATVRPVVADAASPSIPLDRVEAMMNGPRYVDRCLAIRHLRQRGAEGVPLLISAVTSGDERLGLRALLAFESMGQEATSSIDALATVARSPTDPLATDAALALLTLDTARRSTWISAVLGAVLRREPQLAADLCSAILDHPETIEADLAPLVHDERLPARQLCAAILLHGLDQVTRPAAPSFADPSSAVWVPRDFGFGRFRWSGSDAKTVDKALVRCLDVAVPVVRLLDQMAADADPDTRDAVTEPLELLRDGKIELGLPRRYGFACAVVF